ncbi:DNA-processing protein DprA [Schinkia sp. CFF1]
MTKIYWLWLSTLPNIGPVLQKRLIKYYRTPENVYFANLQELQNNIEGVNSRVLEAISQNRSLDKAKRIEELCNKQGIKILTIDSRNYSNIAKACPESPVVLYVKGTLKQTQTSVAIVGTRRCSAYGKHIAQQAAVELSHHNIAIISGMAKGVDGYAHTAAIQTGGYTIAFLANGVDLCYPPEHRRLYEQMLESGAILSKYPPGTIAFPKYFLERNALISAWSDKIIIIEAGERSGALTTANFADKYNREIYAVPHRIDEPNGKGSNILLESHAKPYLGIHSLKILDNAINRPAFTKIQEDPILPGEKELLALLQHAPMLISKTQQVLSMTKVEMEELLFNLELKGKIKIHGEFVLLK